MKQDREFFDFHLLICTNERKTGREDCCSKGSPALIEALKPWVNEELRRLGKSGRARVNRSGCLGRCEEGIACVAYPSGEWLTEVRTEPDEIERIKDWIREQIKKLP